VSFHRNKFWRHPRPNGGDGGKGGDVTFIADRNMHTLLDYKFKQHYSADSGGHGGSHNKKGKQGKDCVLKVPIGTIIRNNENNLLVKDLMEDQQTITVVHGGIGGRGNNHNKTPAPPGEGEEFWLTLELKLIADVGIVGFPNAGKSTFINGVSKVRSKIANYPFTTKSPVLGFVHGDKTEFIIADLPGLIEGAHLGKGLGLKFLKHAERTKILLHMIDMSGSEGRDPLDDYEKIQHELSEYSDQLMTKQKVVVANKMDLPESKANLARFKKKYKEKIYDVSAMEQKGLDKVVKHLETILCKENSRKK
jgi:GTP-binding protein